MAGCESENQPGVKVCYLKRKLFAEILTNSKMDGLVEKVGHEHPVDKPRTADGKNRRSLADIVGRRPQVMVA